MLHDAASPFVIPIGAHAAMPDRPHRINSRLHWQVVCLDPTLLGQAQAALRATGPSDAIERALKLAVMHAGARRPLGVRLPVH
jgi:hypothetical protein